MLTLARKELHDALRNHWLQGYTLLLGLLGWILAVAAAESAAGLGMQTFGRATASLTSLTLTLAPLVALALGGLSIAGERDRGTLERLLAQPIERGQLLLGKAAGLLGSLIVATFVGFVPAGVVLATRTAASLPTLALLAGVLVLVVGALLAVGLLVSVVSQNGGQAQARALFVWFAFVLLWDLILMGTVATASLGPAALALLLVANPVSAGRLLVLLGLEADLHLLGPAGAWLVDTLGPPVAALLLVLVLVAWGGLALGLALRRFRAPLRSRRGSPVHSTHEVMMKRTTATSALALLLVAGLAAGCGEAGSEEAKRDPNAPVVFEVDDALIDKGEQLYLRNCAPCHGPGGKGDGAAAATLNPKPRDHTRGEYMDTLSDLRIGDTIRMGGAAFGYPNMPSSPHLRGEDLAAIIAYVRKLSHAGEMVETVEVKGGF